MTEIDLTVELLDEVLNKDVSFQEALKNKFKNDLTIRVYRPTVAALLGCVLRHNILFATLTKGNKDLTELEKEKIYVILANEYFAKKLKSEDIEAYISSNFEGEKLEFINSLVAKKGNPDSYIPAEINKGTIPYLSIRFNIPEWVLKVWKHFGMSALFKILKSDFKKGSTTVRVRNSLVNLSDVLADSSFTETPVPYILSYKSEEPLRKNGFFTRGELFLEKPGLKAIFDKFYLASDNCELTIYEGNQNPSLLLEALETYKDRIGMNFGVSDILKYPEVSKVINQNQLKNVNFFQANPLEMTAAISSPQDLVIVHPNSTNFDLIKESPDYLLHFKREEMDQILLEQKETLEGCSAHVADQGNLLYIVSTMSWKECGAQITEFLKNHEDFKLVEEKQFFPYEKYGTSVYYALLHKGMDVAKDPITPGNMIDGMIEKVNVQSAEAKR